MTIKLQNTFLSPREQEIQNLAYFGEFLALLSFDDGWNWVIYPLFQQYIKEIQTTLPEWVTFESYETDSVSNIVRIILKSSSFSPESIDTVSRISQDIQARFFCTPVWQYLWWDTSRREIFQPLAITTEDFEHPLFFRLNLQDIATEILVGMYDVERINHLIEKFQHIESPQTHDTIKSQSTLKKAIQEKIEKLRGEFENTHAEYYLMMSTKKRNDTGKVIDISHLYDTSERLALWDDDTLHDLLKECEGASELEFIWNMLGKILGKLETLNIGNTHEPRVIRNPFEEKAEVKEILRDKQASLSKKNNAFIQSYELTPSDRQELQTLNDTLLGNIVRIIQSNFNQSVNIINQLISEEIKKSCTLQLANGLTFNVKFKTKAVEKLDSHWEITIESRIGTNIPGSTLKGLLMSPTVNFTQKVTKATDPKSIHPTISHRFKKLKLFGEKLSPYFWNKLKYMEDFGMDLQKWFEWLSKMPELDSNEEMAPLEKDLEKTVTFLKRYMTLKTISSLITDEIKEYVEEHLFSPYSSDLEPKDYESMCHFFQTLDILGGMNAQGNISRSVCQSEEIHLTDFPIKSQELLQIMRIENQEDKVIRETFYNKETIVSKEKYDIEIENTNWKIPALKKWHMWNPFVWKKQWYRFENNVVWIDFTQYFLSLSSNYVIEIINPNEEQSIWLYKFIPLIDGEQSPGEEYYVRCITHLLTSKWDVYIPCVTAHVIPVWERFDLMEDRIKEIHRDIWASLRLNMKKQD